ncbi:MAG TPA: hypothetical protein VFX85_10030 [Solirubrobacterales bacterium]|nr:hypothetical protein [Solirubrobacterales bacterium]
MTWAIIGLICSTAAEQIGPNAIGPYLLALGMAAIALMRAVAPDRMPGGREGRDEKGAR